MWELDRGMVEIVGMRNRGIEESGNRGLESLGVRQLETYGIEERRW